MTQAPERLATSSFSPAPSAVAQNANLARILELDVPVSAVLAERPLPVETILQIRPGTILEFDVPFGSDLSLVVGNRVLGSGQAVKVGEHFGLRITTIDTVRLRIEALAQPQQALST